MRPYAEYSKISWYQLQDAEHEEWVWLWKDSTVGFFKWTYWLAHICMCMLMWRPVIDSLYLHVVASLLLEIQSLVEHIEHKLTNLAMPIGQQAWAIHLSLLLQYSSRNQYTTTPRFYLGAGDPNSGPHPSTVSTFPTKPSHQPFTDITVLEFQAYLDSATVQQYQ